MASTGLVLAFFGDAATARSAFDDLRRAGMRQTALLSKKSPDDSKDERGTRLVVSRPATRAVTFGAAGAAAGLIAGRLVAQAIAPSSPSSAQDDKDSALISTTETVMSGAGALAGGALGATLAAALDSSLSDRVVQRIGRTLTSGESVIIVGAPTNQLSRALDVLRAAGTPAIFVERAHALPSDVNKAPLRSEVLSPEQLRELAATIGRKHHKVTLGGGEFLLQRLQSNQRVVQRVVRGLREAARLDQAVSLSAEWLLDNNYIVQGQINDVERNLTPKFYRELPVRSDGRYQGVPRTYIMASELVKATDSRLDKEAILEFVSAYQAAGTTLTTGELWAVPLMLRLALVENLRRLTAQADQRQRERERADFWANRLLTAATREPDLILSLLADLSRERKVIAPYFADRLVSHLFDEESALGPVRAWLERKFSRPLAEITSAEQRRQAADSVSVGNAITSLRFLSALDWRECFEQLSLVDAILGQDPAGVYRSMDFDTRDRYRKQVEKLARGSEKGEVDVAQLAVQSAASDTQERVRRAAPSHGEREHEAIIYQPSGHVGYYLVDDGRVAFEKAVGYEPSKWNQGLLWLRDHPETWYLGGIAVGTGVALWTINRFAQAVGGALPLPLRLLFVLPASEAAVQVINYAATRVVPPRPLPKMEFREGVPARWKSIVVIPMLLGSVEEARENAHQLELHFLANPDPNLRFALLADYVDAESKHTSEDAPRFEAARQAIDELNARHGERFFLFIRDRRWSETEDRWMGWERKRGKLEEFNAFLLGRRDVPTEHLHAVVGDWAELDGIRFVVTLDADTQMPYGAARRLVETLAHPLNRPVIDENHSEPGRRYRQATFSDRRLVKRGYTIIQPRVDTMLPSAMRTRYSRLFSDAFGLDPYTAVVSDVYQDVFSEGSYHGKGIYDLDAFARVLGDRFPEATLLSHDLLEGAHVRVGLASDIVLLDTFPPTYGAAAKRNHRWTRGDWQILDWVFGKVPARDGRDSNPLSLLNRWKIKDNLRRSLLAPASLIMLAGGWSLGGSSAIAASAGVAGLILWPTFINLFTRVTSEPESLLRSRHEVGRGLMRAWVEVALMPHQAGLNIDAIVRALYRKYVSHQLLLEWRTSASTYRGAQNTAFLLRLAFGSLVAGGAAAALWFFGSPVALVSATPYLLAWASAPLVVAWLDKPRPILEDRELSNDDAQYLRGVARATWRYFDDFVGPQTNWLPPDNYQEALNVEIAQRTSPTNMGLWLLACLAAHDFGWLSLDEVATRTGQTLETFDELEKFEGHLLNWYGSLNAEPLRPRYVSAVDSGNLLGSLWTLARGVKEVSRAPLFDARPLHGLSDVLTLLETALDKEARSFESEIAEVRRLLAERIEGETSTLDIIETLRSLESPVGQLSRALSMRALPRRASQRSRSDFQSPATDPRFSITPASYWAAQLGAQLDGWMQSVNRYARWMELLAQPSTEWLLSLGPDAPDLRRRVLENSPSLTQIARGEVEPLLELVARRERAGVPREVSEWAARVQEEFGRARWLAGEMLASCENVVDRARGLADGMNMTFLYDEQRKLFSIGYNVEERRLDGSYYDLLASECRLASFCSVARGDVPAEHWVALGRRFGETPVGPALMSWSGTMFEYLMPLLFQRGFENSLLEHAVQTAVEAQIDYGRRRGVPWGISESAFAALDAARTYQYKAFGVPSLGLKRGLDEDLVIAPYATLMATMVNTSAALQNLRELERIGARGDYGFYEAIDFTRERLEEDSLVKRADDELEGRGGRSAAAENRGAVVRCFMVHHQGMALLALQNVLLNWPVQRRFHSDVVVQAAEPLLYEKIPEAPPVLEASVEENARPVRLDLGVGASERTISPDTSAPRVHLLGSQEFGTLITAAGSGTTRWRDFELLRWRADTTRDNWGHYLYLRDLDSHLTWSATHQPVRRTARRSNVSFKTEKVEFERRDSEIETRLEVCVSPEDAAEVRRVTLVNHSNRERRIELTSFSELALAPHAADRAHPAFGKLFIQTAVVPERDALIAWRRPRKTGDEPVWVAHQTASDRAADEVQIETDRAKFLGRGRSNENPVALEGDLTGTVGAVLDPCLSLRRRLTLRPGERVQMTFVTSAAESEEALHRLIEKYSDFDAGERAFDLAWTHSQLELHHLQISAADAEAFQQLAGYLVYPHPALRAPARRIRDNVKGQSGLWAYGISGDLPMMVVAVDNARDLPAVRQAIMAHTFWRTRGLKCDLVILNEQAGGYAQDLTHTLQKLIEGSTPYTGVEKPGGVFLRTTDTLPPEDLTLLLSVARVVLIAARGGIAQQLGRLSETVENAPRFVAATKETSDPTLPLPFLQLPYFNGLGGFTEDGREYAIYLSPGAWTPAPWINVFANEHFGALASESGMGFCWYGNSQANRMLPWNNDPVSDTPSEAIYVRDEETGAFWSPTPLPIREDEAYRARHGQGYSVWEHNSHGIEGELTTFVPQSDNGDMPVRVQSLKLRNRTNRSRKLQVTFYGEWVLGTTREETVMQIVTSWDTVSSTLLARNAYHPAYPNRVGFAAAVPRATHHSADRTAFLGRNGSPQSPTTMRRKHVLEATGAGLDPCAVLQVEVELEPGEETRVAFLVGEAGDIDEARSIVSRLRDEASIQKSLDSTKNWWDELLNTLQVDVPDLAVNFLLNRWLPYQTLSCRIWARSAFYQSGGAWGYRDQLQDSLALTTLYPKAARDQILRCCAHQFEEGDVQHWWHPPGDAGVRTLITDDLLFLPYAVAQYVRVTGDETILDEVVPFLSAPPLEEGEHEKYFEPQISEQSADVYQHCLRAIEKGCTWGPHGLPLIGGGDWNDGLNRVGIEGKGESVWLAWFVVDVLNSFAEICERRGESERAQEYTARAQKYAHNVDEGAWDGNYYRRGYYDDGTPLGSSQSEEAKIDSLPQSWAFITGAGDAERAKRAMASVEEHLIKKDEKMILLFTPAFDQTEKDPGYIKGYLPGVRENGGQYTHAACWVAYAYARAGMGNKAVEALRLLNPVEHARTPQERDTYKVEPYVVCADVYNLPGHVGRGGWTWYTGSCGWMYRVWIEGVLGFHKRGDELEINPSIPSDWKEFKMTYRHGQTAFEIKVENPRGVQHGVASVSLDGKLLPDKRIPLADDGKTHRVVVTLGESAALESANGSGNGVATLPALPLSEAAEETPRR